MRRPLTVYGIDFGSDECHVITAAEVQSDGTLNILAVDRQEKMMTLVKRPDGSYGVKEKPGDDAGLSNPKSIAARLERDSKADATE